MDDSIKKIIEDLEGYIEGCSESFLSKKTMVDSEVIYDFTSELKLNIPKQIEDAESIILDKIEIMNDANRDATVIVEKAKEKANQLVDSHEITARATQKAEQILAATQEEVNKMLAEAKQEADQMRMDAKEESDTMLAKARKTSKELTEGGYDYVNEILSQAQLVLTDTLEQSNSHYHKFQNYLKNQTDVIARNKVELATKKNSYGKRDKEKKHDK